MRLLKKRFLLFSCIVLLLSSIFPCIPLLAEDSNTWVVKAPMNVDRYNFQTEVVDGKIYSIGGGSSAGYLTSIEKYDPLTDKSTTLAPMPRIRTHFTTEVIDKKIYVLGEKKNLMYMIRPLINGQHGLLCQK